jgi:hypothetical protein
MPISTFKAPRRHNRRFPGKLGARPDKSHDRRLGALARHIEALDKFNKHLVNDNDRRERLQLCINNTKKNLGME